MKKALIFALLSFGMVLGGVSHAKEYKSMTVRIACSTPPGSVQAVPLARLAEIVHKESNGKIKRMSGIHLAIPVFSKGYRQKQGKVVP